MTEIELEMENDTELRIECEQIYIMDDYEQLKNKPRLNGKEISGDMYETDPTIPEWAKAQNKPSYTPEEVNAVNNDNQDPKNLYIETLSINKGIVYKRGQSVSR